MFAQPCSKEYELNRQLTLFLDLFTDTLLIVPSSNIEEQSLEGLLLQIVQSTVFFFECGEARFLSFFNVLVPAEDSNGSLDELRVIIMNTLILSILSFRIVFHRS